MVTAKREPAPEETQTQQITPLGAASRFAAPKTVFWIVLGFFLGRIPLGGDHFLTTFLAYVLRCPKTIILQFWGFLGFKHSRGHGSYNFHRLQFLIHSIHKRYVSNMYHRSNGSNRSDRSKRSNRPTPPKHQDTKAIKLKESVGKTLYDMFHDS